VRAVHPAAAVWPMMTDDELDALAQDIAESGLLHPIVLTPDGQLLDGRNRLAACELARVKPTFTTYDDDPAAYVLSANEYRRHMTKGQRAMAAWMTAATRPEGVNNSHLARTVDVDRAQVVWARTVAEHTPAAVPNVISGATPLKAAYDAAVKARNAADSEASRLTNLPPDLAAQVREESLTLAEAEAAAVARERERQRIIREGEDSAGKIGGTIGHVLAVIGANQQGANIDTDKLLAQLNEGIDALAALAGEQ
jgi:hypothetical protein